MTEKKDLAVVTAPTRFVWLSDEYSVPRESLCWHEAPSPNADHHCVRQLGHAGKHLFRIATGLDLGGVETRDYSHKDRGA